MLEVLAGLPDGVVGFEAVGTIHSADYEQTLIPALDAIDGPLRLVYVLGERFEGYSAGAALQDAKLGLDRHGTWHRAAIVSDADWIRHVAGALGWMIPGEFEVFPLDRRDDAIAWVASD